MSKHGRVYSGYQLDIGAGAFERAFVTNRNAVTNTVKRISRTSERSGKEKEEMLKKDLERNVALCLHNSFCRNTIASLHFHMYFCSACRTPGNTSTLMAVAISCFCSRFNSDSKEPNML